MSNHLTSITLHPEKYPTSEHYPFTLPVFHETSQITFDTPITLFVGENGSGKSTLLQAIVRLCQIYIWGDTGGTRLKVNHFEKLLYQYITPEWSNGRVPGSFFGAQMFRNFAHILDEWASTDPGQLEYFGGESLVTKSHGQSLMTFFRNRYKLKGIYLLDEPETALSPKSQLELLKIISENSRAGHAQFIIASHSPILLACADAKIYSFDKSPVELVSYEDTEHYGVYREFLMDYKKYL